MSDPAIWEACNVTINRADNIMIWQTIFIDGVPVERENRLVLEISPDNLWVLIKHGEETGLVECKYIVDNVHSVEIRENAETSP